MLGYFTGVWLTCNTSCHISTVMIDCSLSSQIVCIIYVMTDREIIMLEPCWPNKQPATSACATQCISHQNIRDDLLWIPFQVTVSELVKYYKYIDSKLSSWMKPRSVRLPTGKTRLVYITMLEQSMIVLHGCTAQIVSLQPRRWLRSNHLHWVRSFF